MSGHTMTVTFNDGWQEFSPKCHEPAEAMCRAEWDCECEYWYVDGADERGPWHEIANDYASEDERQARARHYGKHGGECAAVLSLESADMMSEVGGGEVTFPIAVTFDDDYVSWAATS